MLKDAILRYKWYALGSFFMVIGVVASSLLQPHYLKSVLSAVIQNNQEKIYEVGKPLLIIAL
ncbi:TPA: ABC transporter ATP-binding protein, partial [Streptococcus pyogenes]